MIQVTELRKEYRMGTNVVPALRGVSFAVGAGEFVAVMGPSGSGKSTCMNLIGCLDRPSGGNYELDGVEVTRMDPVTLADLRNRKLGFVFQGFNLLPRMDALGNVMLPMVYAGISGRARRERAVVGGQQQRVAIARALVNSPSLILADEPTGALDSRTSLEIMAILQRLNADGATILLVTHEAEVAAHCSRRIVFRDGRVVSDEPIVERVSATATLASLPSEEAAA
ncbi:MAG: ABC transporter ATP-binding protein [Chloroflexi bacterium]|nr:ABC transporter ATP-binding protein [Chloroflexota bacterium]